MTAVIHTKTQPFRLKDLAGSGGLIVDGDWIESKDQDPNGDVRLIQLADIDSGRFTDRSARFLTSATAERLKCTYLAEGDILVARLLDPLAHACIFPGDSRPCITAVDVCIVRPDPAFVYGPWLKWAISSPFFQAQVQKYASGTTRKRISRKNLESIELFVPPIPVQKEIAATLDKLLLLQQLRERSIVLTHHLVSSTFASIFGDEAHYRTRWQTARLGDCWSLIRNGISPSSNGTIPFCVLTLSAITGGEYNDFAFKEGLFENIIPEEKLVNDQDFLICRGNGNPDLVGRGKFPAISDSNKAFPDTIIAVRPKAELLHPLFLETLWNKGFIRKQIESGARTTSGIYKINQQLLQSIEIIVPPMEEQIRFSEIALHIRKLAHSKKAFLASLDELFASSMHHSYKDTILGDLSHV